MIDPVELQVLGGALRAICEEMGAVLIRSAHSANIKERRDASTALFDPRGQGRRRRPEAVGLVMGFAALDVRQIERGCRLLAQAVDDIAPRRPRKLDQNKVR